jgi:hypothetical protein
MRLRVEHVGHAAQPLEEVGISTRLHRHTKLSPLCKSARRRTRTAAKVPKQLPSSGWLRKS